jgi:integrase
MAKRNGLPANVSEFQDRHGKWRLRYRAKGQPTYYFKGMPGSELFREELEACRAAKIAPASATRRSPPGSISALIALYYGTPAYTGLAASSQKTYRSVLERFRNEHGLKSVATLERRHIKTILGGMSATPAAANKLLDKLKILMALAMDEGWRKDDPTQGVKGFKIRSDGFHTWTEDEIETYCAVHGLGTKARLALDLMLYTGQRRSDAVLMGKQHFDAGRVRVRQLKTGAVVSIRVHPQLQASIDAAVAAGVVGDLSLLVTDYGLPFSSNGFGNKMRDWCDAANLSHCASHGLRKAAARRLAEAGCTHEQIKAITGHTTDAEVSRYVAAANQLKLADQAIDAIDPTSRTG